MANRPLAEIITEMIDADLVRLPVHPELPGQVRACLAADGGGPERLWALVGADPSSVCSMLRAANSSFYAGLPKTLTIEEAVTRLGRDQAVRLVADNCLGRRSISEQGLLARYMPGLWQHARGCALGARWLASRCGYPAIAERAYFAGLLHDIGKLVLLSALQTVVCDKDLDLDFSEALISEVLATMHVEQGLRLCDEWHLPDIYRAVVAEHHAEEPDARDTVIALVKLANKGCRKVGLGLDRNPDLVLPTTGEAQSLGIDEIALAEFEIMLEDRFF